MINSIIQYLRRYALWFIGAAVAFAATWAIAGAFENFQIGLSPFEFLVKIPAKLLFLAIAWLATLFVVKYGFPTVSAYCKKDSANHVSQFTLDFAHDQHNPLIWYAIATHLGVFIAVCLLMALAF